jgi:GAF domain-containing protein
VADHPDQTPLAPEVALGQLGRIRLTDHSMRSLLAEVVHLVQRTLPGRTEASVSLLSGDGAFTAATSGQLAETLDAVQYDGGRGPCLEAAREGHPVEIADMRSDARWPGFAERAVADGCLSSLSLPLPVHEKVSGSINVYARDPAAFDDPSRAFALRFSSYAAVVAGNMLVYESALDRAQNLEAALQSRAVIDQAKGVLMERFKITPDEAFRVLVRVSQDTNAKLRDVAQRFVDTGELPGPPSR